MPLTTCPPLPTPPAAATIPALPRPAPWKTDRAAELRRRAAAAEAALAAVTAVGGDSDLEGVLRQQIDGHRLALEAEEKKPAKPLIEQIAGCRAYIERARKRVEAKAKDVQAAEARVRDLTSELGALRSDVAEHEAHLQQMEREALSSSSALPAPIVAVASPTAGLLEQVTAIAALASNAVLGDAGAAEDIRNIQAISSRLQERLSTGGDALMGSGTPTQLVNTGEADTVPATMQEITSAEDAIAEARAASNASGRARAAPY